MATSNSTRIYTCLTEVTDTLDTLGSFGGGAVFSISSYRMSAVTVQSPPLRAEPKVRESVWPNAFGPVPYYPSLVSAGRFGERQLSSTLCTAAGYRSEEACELHGISVEEFLAWARDLDRYGVPGLRATRYQIYRD